MPSRLSVFHPAGRLSLPNNPFGKDVANLQLFRALAQHGGLEQLDVLSLKAVSEEQLQSDFAAEAAVSTRVVPGAIVDVTPLKASGALLRGAPNLQALAWHRRRGAHDRAYSLMGLVHTIAPPAIREMIGHNVLAPVHPWDAIICTSPSVQDALRRMFDEHGDWLAERTGGQAPPQPMLPILPLGVDGARFASLADRPAARARVREQMGLGGEDTLVLWVGRLSYFEKAFPSAMFRAVQQAAAATGKKVTFAMAGWFPSPEDRGLYAQAAAAHAPDVAVEFLDGNDHELVGELWAGADIFLSLVDNIQETFGITPLEAMAAGLPVVVSDWDGYRFTVRDGAEGFLVPTLGGPNNGVGYGIAARHAMEVSSYQTYVGSIAQHTAVHVGRAAQALARLIEDPDLRRRMGSAGRERIRTTFDWPVVARQYVALADELSAVRALAPDMPTRHPLHPLKGDPFRDFAGFATHAASLDTVFAVPPGVTAEDVRRAGAVHLDATFASWRADLSECVEAFGLIASGQATTAREVLLAFPVGRRRLVDTALVWMAKQGLLDWLAD
jgi:D-inositol-3-phosphate glycosyltransferase